MTIAAYTEARELIHADELTGPIDLYRALLTLKNGFGNGVMTLGCYAITKAQAKRAGIEWAFVVQSVEILGLTMRNRAGRHGHSISK